MTTYVTGLFIAAGNCPPEEQVDPREDLARVLIVMPKSTLRDVQRLPMYEEVTVIPTEQFNILMRAASLYLTNSNQVPTEHTENTEEVTTKHTKNTKGETG